MTSTFSADAKGFVWMASGGTPMQDLTLYDRAMTLVWTVVSVVCCVFLAECVDSFYSLSEASGLEECDGKDCDGQDDDVSVDENEDDDIYVPVSLWRGRGARAAARGVPKISVKAVARRSAQGVTVTATSDSARAAWKKDRGVRTARAASSSAETGNPDQIGVRAGVHGNALAKEKRRRARAGRRADPPCFAEWGDAAEECGR